jgi:hypothetical protein|tara:strand:- start:312 stop:530 length:219 start_codon:yes stop_codon:yes gene_type:complete
MRDASHMESVEKWARYVKKNPVWKKIHTEFINSQFEKAYGAMARILKTPNGKEKIRKIYKIKNVKGYPSIFN